MKKVLIVDDSEKNLNAAREAAKRFEGVEFDFTSSASYALRELSHVDAIVTDLFFPAEKDDGLLEEFKSYIEKTTNSSCFKRVVSDYYEGNYSHANESLTKALEVIHSGPQFPYGGALMLKAKSLAVKHILVTDLHRHNTMALSEKMSKKVDQNARPIDGMIVLLPLMEERIISIEEAESDGCGSQTYIGFDLMPRDEAYKTLKENPEVWASAISLVLNQ